MKLEDTKALIAGCSNGSPATCSHACPFHLDIRAFADRCARGKWLAAYKSMRNELIFPVVVSRLCDAPCRQHCQRSAIGDAAIDLPALERAAVKLTKKRPVENYAIPPRDERLAVVGAGISGLSLALVMAQKKYSVTVFDKAEGWGGRLRSHEDWPVLEEDIALQFSLTAVDFRFGSAVASLDELSDFDAVYIATGSGGDDFGLLPTYDPALQTTGNPRVFLGGELCGTTLMEGIAQGASFSRVLEAFMQTGRAETPTGSEQANICENYPALKRAVSVPLTPEGEDGYSEEDAIREGARCMQCDCAECMVGCEMLDQFRKKPEKIAIEVYTDSQVNPPIATHSITRQTYSCNMCGHCKSVCPEEINFADLFSMSRRDRRESGDAPLALSDFWLREMDFHIGEAAVAAAPRDGTCEYLFFPGCQLGAYNPEHVTMSYEYLAGRMNTGIYLSCCAAPAYWAGDDARQNAHIDEIRRTAKQLGNPKFIFACATCESMFEKFLPEIERVSLYEILAQDEALKPSPAFDDASVFDPCAARGDSGMQDGVRTIAENAGTRLSELPEKNRCCGYGGNIQLANPKLFEKITANRSEMSDKPYIVYCANCRAVFTSRGKSCAHILDMAWSLEPMQQLPKIAERRENSRLVKGALMKILGGGEFSPERPAWHGLNLVIAPELADEIDCKLISADDIREAIYRAEMTGDRFIDADDGSCQCCLERPVLTYWVRYKKLDGGEYEVLNAYYHRMSFSREE